jgi:multidrug transporter EmrE-like cation transporter
MLLLTFHPVGVALVTLGAVWAGLGALAIEPTPAVVLGALAASVLLALALRQLRLAVQTCLWNAGHRVR